MIETLNRDRRSYIAGDKIMSHFPFRGSPPHLTQVRKRFSSIKLNLKISSQTMDSIDLLQYTVL